MTAGEAEQRFPARARGKSAGEQPVNDFAPKLFTGFRGESIVQNNAFTFARPARTFFLVP